MRQQNTGHSLYGDFDLGFKVLNYRRSWQWRQREFKVGGTNRRMGWGVGREVASYSRMKSA